MMTDLPTKVKVMVDLPEDCVLRVKHLPEGAVFLKEHRLWIKQDGGYCLALDNFVRYQVRPEEQVERVFDQITISVSPDMRKET